MLLGCFCLSGCITRLFGGREEPAVAGENGSISLSKLERIILNFADRDVTLVSDACEAVKRGAATPEERRRAQHFKLANGSAVYDIVTSPNALGHLVDLYVLIQLQHLVLVDEGNAARIFGAQGAERMAVVLGQLRADIDGFADLSMKSDRKARLDGLIRSWRERNPRVEFVSGIRFGDLPEVSGKGIHEVIPAFFDVLNPLDDTSRSVDETRQLAERAFYFSKRLPKLLHWQTDAALDDVLVKPGVDRALKDLTQAGGSIDRVSRVVERLPDLVASERKAFLAAWDARQKEISSALGDLRATLVEGRAFAAQVEGAGKAVEQTFDSIQRVFQPEPGSVSSEGAKPFDIGEYAAAATEISRMAKDASSLVTDLEALLASPAWTKRQEDLNRLAGQAVSQAEEGSKRILDHLMWRMVLVLAAFFALLLLYRLLGGRRGGGKTVLRTADGSAGTASQNDSPSGRRWIQHKSDGRP